LQTTADLLLPYVRTEIAPTAERRMIMVCPECNGRGESIYFVETDRDENTVTVEQRKGICRTCNGCGETAYTNADRIRSMSDEELAKAIEPTAICNERTMVECVETYGRNCDACLLDWLKQPAGVE
jgi:hypothetical protein